MRAWILGVSSAAALPAAASAAEPVILSCTGHSSPILSTGGLGEQESVAFEVTIDMEKRTLLENSQPMVVRELSDDQIVYSRFKPGAFSMLMSDSPTTISRKTGLWRFSRGSGSCKVQETKKLF